MRRRTVHLTFGAVALAFASVAIYEAVTLRQAKAVNAAIFAASMGDDAAVSRFPEAAFARARSLATQGQNERALKAYKEIGRNGPPHLATAALYNAGNLQLRQALKEGPDATVRALPLIELAKQNYRSVLRRDPQNWDARYNLERALWLAPEVEEEPILRLRRDAENRVMSTLQSTRADLP